MKICLTCHVKFSGSDWTCPSCAFTPPTKGGFVVLAPEMAEGGGGFRPEIFEQIALLEEKNFWFVARNRLIVWALRRYFPEIGRYLEIGCGTGYVLMGVAQAYPLASLVGSEIFSIGLPYAASRVKSVELIQMDARQIPYVEEFGVIGAFDVLEHIEEDELVLRAMWSALRPGGGIAVTVPQHPWLWSAADESACHVRRYKTGELREKVLRAGFKLQFETSFVSLLLPAMVASRFTKQRIKEGDDSFSELKLPTWMNRGFEFLMNVERYLIERGVRFNIGGSRLLIATKEG